MNPLARSQLQLDLSKPDLSILVDPGSPRSSIGTPTPIEPPERPATPPPEVTKVAVQIIRAIPLPPPPSPKTPVSEHDNQ